MRHSPLKDRSEPAMRLGVFDITSVILTARNDATCRPALCPDLSNCNCQSSPRSPLRYWARPRIQ